MRLILLSVLCLFVPLVTFTQTTGNYNYSVASKGYSVMQMPKMLKQDAQHYLSTYVTGGMIKLNDNQINYRISGSYFNKAMDFDKNCRNCDIASGSITDYTFKLGFEKNFNYSHIQPYFAIDAGYRYNGFKGTATTINNQRAVLAANDVRDTKDGFTISPVIGIKINIINQVSLFAESGLEFFNEYVRQEKVSQDDLTISSENRFTRGEFLINPIAVGIQIHLGNRN